MLLGEVDQLLAARIIPFPPRRADGLVLVAATARLRDVDAAAFPFVGDVAGDVRLPPFDVLATDASAA